jgi:hypothetical protein
MDACPEETVAAASSGQSVASLTVADGRTWSIAAADRHAGVAVQRLRKIMRLPSVRSSDFDLLLCGGEAPAREWLVHREPLSRSPAVAVTLLGDCGGNRLPVSMWFSPNGSLYWLRAPVGASDPRLHVSIVAQFIARLAQDQEGLLLHGALAELNGAGVILAGASGAGKTTASSRLAPPWRSRSDDAVLIVKATDGRYWVHPWPTWSRLSHTGLVDPTWDVQRALPLAAVCFLRQNEADAIAQMGAGRAAGLLVQSAEQAATLMPYTSVVDRRAKRIQRLNNACALSRAVPSYQLELSLAGTFWRLLEDVLDVPARTQVAALVAEPPAVAT